MQQVREAEASPRLGLGGQRSFKEFLVGQFFKSSSVGNLEANLDSNPDCEEMSTLSNPLQSLSQCLVELKSYLAQPSEIAVADKKSECQKRLSEVFMNLQDLFQHHPMIKNSPILNSASSIIDKFKKAKFDGSKEELEDVNSSIDNFATALTNCVSEYWMEKELGIPNQMSTKAKSVEYLTNMDHQQSKRSSSSSNSTSENSDVLFRLDSGVEMAFQRAQAWSKYCKELITYIERRNNLYGEFTRNLSKLAKSVQQNISEDSFQPFRSLFSKALLKDVEMCSMGQAARSLIHNQLFVSPMNARRADHDKTRKDWKNVWTRQLRKMHDSETNLRKAKATYISRQQEHEKLKEQAQKAESESQSQNWGGAKNEAKAEKKRKQEDEALQKAMDAETSYKQCILEANTNQNLLEQTKISVLNNMRQLLLESDHALKRATVDYFKLMNTITDTIPQNFLQLHDESLLYNPGSHYVDYLKQIRPEDFPPAIHKHYIFEPYVPHARYTDTPQYRIVDPGSVGYHGYPDNSYKGSQSVTNLGPLDDSDSISGESSVSLESSPGVSPSQPHRKKTVKDLAGLMSPGVLEDDDSQEFGAVATFKGMKLSSAAQTHVLKKLRAPSKCCECYSYVYFNGAECDKCHMVSHKKCLEVLKIPCGDSLLLNVGDLFPLSQSTTPYHLQSVPFLVSKCISEIDKQGLHVKGLYRLSAVKSKVEQLCQCFDTDERSIDLSDQNPNVVANVLKLYLRKLPEPLLTFKLYPVFINIAKNEMDLLTIKSSLKQAIDQLPFANYRTCAILFEHLSRVAQEHHINQMNASNLGIVFGPTLLRPREVASVTHLVDAPFQSKAVELLIENVESVFGVSEASSEKGKGSLLVRSTSATLTAGDVSPSWLKQGLTGDLLKEFVKEVPHFQKFQENEEQQATTTSSPLPTDNCSGTSAIVSSASASSVPVETSSRKQSDDSSHLLRRREQHPESNNSSPTTATSNISF